MDRSEHIPVGVAIVVAGGDTVTAEIADGLPRADRVIAADSGLDHADAIGLHTDVVVGDMDSVEPGLLQAAAAAGATIVRHPAAKDATDLELALAHAIDEGHHRIIVIGGGGGRLSHLLGNAAVIASATLTDVAVEWRVADAVLRVVRPWLPTTIPGAAGDLVSLLPFGGLAVGVTTDGLRWHLTEETLQPGSTRGISNEMTDSAALVTLRRGVLLAVHERTAL